MLSERARNTAVGLTMLAGLALLMYGILLLGRWPMFAKGLPYTITLEAPNANGAQAGTKVDLNGVNIGQVTDVQLITDQKTGQMQIEVYVRVNAGHTIPNNAKAVLGKQAIGTSYVSLFATDGKAPTLATDGTGRLKAEMADTGLIPREVIDSFQGLKDDIGQLARELTKVAEDLHVLLKYNSPEDIAKANPDDPKRPVENISTLVVRLNRTVASVEELMTDKEVKGQFRTIVANLAEASAQLKTTLKTIESTVGNANTTLADTGKKIGDAATQAQSSLATTERQIIKISERLVAVLESIEKTTNTIAKGQGTAGKLVNDPRLYDGLVDLTKSLQSTLDDLNILIRKWREEGVKMQLK